MIRNVLNYLKINITIEFNYDLLFYLVLTTTGIIFQIILPWDKHLFWGYIKIHWLGVEYVFFNGCTIITL